MAVSGGAAAAEEPPQIPNSQRGIFVLKWGRGVITDSSFNLVLDGQRGRESGGVWGGTEGGGGGEFVSGRIFIDTDKLVLE